MDNTLLYSVQNPIYLMIKSQISLYKKKTKNS